MKRFLVYVFFLFGGMGACIRETGWEAHPTPVHGVRKVALEMAVSEYSVFEEYVHSLSIYAFLQVPGKGYVYDRKVMELTTANIRELETGIPSGPTTSDSKIVNLTLPDGMYEFYVVANDVSGAFVAPSRGGPADEGYLPYPAGGVEHAYFMGRVVLKPGVAGTSSIFIVLSRVVSRLTVVVSDVPARVDTIRYRVSGMFSRILLTGVAAGHPVSMTGIYVREQENIVLNPDTVMYHQLLFPASRSGAQLQLVFSAGGVVVREKEVVLLGLDPNEDLYIPGRWEGSLTTRVPIFSIPFYSNFRSSD